MKGFGLGGGSLLPSLFRLYRESIGIIGDHKCMLNIAASVLAFESRCGREVRAEWVVAFGRKDFQKKEVCG